MVREPPCVNYVHITFCRLMFVGVVETPYICTLNQVKMCNIIYIGLHPYKRNNLEGILNFKLWKRCQMWHFLPLVVMMKER